jgi:ankyrin repeat protein
MEQYEIVDGVEPPRMSDDDLTQELLEACRYGEASDIERLAEILESNPAMVDCRDCQGRTPLHMAAANGHLSILCKLMSYRPTQNLPNHEGNTALHYAADSNHLDVAAVLLKNGWSPVVKNALGRSPLGEVSGRRGFDEMEVLLLKNDESADAYQSSAANAVIDVDDQEDSAPKNELDVADDDAADDDAGDAGVDPSQQFEAGMDDIE